MKNLKLQLMSLLLAAALLLSMVPVSALAWENAEALPVEVEVQRTEEGEGGYDAVLENRPSRPEPSPAVQRHVNVLCVR